MSNESSSSEPSMEQILESIAEIIADDSGASNELPPVSYEATPVMHNTGNQELGALDYAAAPAFLQSSPVVSAHPIAEPISTGSLTDRLANMDQNTVAEQAVEEIPMRPVAENNGVTPPGFMGVTQVAEPVAVNMPVPQMLGQQPTMGTQGFPVESAEDFLANNAQRPPEALNVAPQEIVQAPVVQPAPEFALNPALVPTAVPAPEPQLTAAVESAPVVPQVMTQPLEQAEVAPVTPSPTADVLSSFMEAEKEVASQPVLSVEPEAVVISPIQNAPAEASLLDASYISTTAQAPLSAEPVNVQVDPIVATPAVEAVLPNVVSPEPVMTAPVVEPTIAAQPEVAAVPEQSGTVAGVDLNSAIHTMVQPMVQKWLDENLSKVVEEVVRHELASALTKK